MQQYLLEAGQPSLLVSMMPLILMVVIFYFILIRPQKKREKQTQEMRNAIEVGDEIVTGGGIVGRVVSIKDDTILIESGSANTKLRIAKWAIQTNVTAQENARERAQDAAAQRQLEQEEKDRLKAEGKASKRQKKDTME